jgi:hypothetical protein
MAYNLPPPWDPGFCMPKNVNDEGLERRAFITKWQPRGSYDNPAVGTGGYAVPKYVLDEGYGQGTYTTKWMPSGSYAGPRVPNWLNRRPELVSATRLPGGGTVAAIAPLGDDEPSLPADYENYGQRAAQALIARVAALPQSKRAAALRAIVDKVDKSLWTRTQDIFRRLVQQGMAPADAFPVALARAMSAGFAAEIVNTGIRGSAPQAKSLLGLGCYGCAAILALGADEAEDCQTQPGFSWIYGTQGVPGHWQRTPAGAQDVPACKVPPAGAQTVDPSTTTVRSHTGPTTQMVAVSMTPDMKRPFYFSKDISTEKSRDFSKLPDIMIVPPGLPDAKLAAWRKGTHVMEELPDDWVKFIRDDMTNKGPTKDGAPFAYNNDGLTETQAADTKYWMETVLGIPPGTTIYTTKSWLPNSFVKWPTNGAKMGIYVMIERVDRDFWKKYPNTPNEGANNPLVVKIWASKVPEQNRSLFEDLAQSIVEFFAQVVDVVEDGLKDLANVACDVLNSPAGPAAGAAAAGAAGVPPAAGAAGATIAKGACGTNPPPTPPTPPARSILPYVLLGGGALVALAVLTKKKKQP